MPSTCYRHYDFNMYVANATTEQYNTFKTNVSTALTAVGYNCVFFPMVSQDFSNPSQTHSIILDTFCNIVKQNHVAGTVVHVSIYDNSAKVMDS